MLMQCCQIELQQVRQRRLAHLRSLRLGRE